MTRVEHSCLSAPALSIGRHSGTAQRAHAIELPVTAIATSASLAREQVYAHVMKRLRQRGDLRNGCNSPRPRAAQREASAHTLTVLRDYKWRLRSRCGCE
eukprot:5732226-Prymnesium_polylepis.1